MAAASAFRAAEELSRKAELAEITGDEAILAAAKVSGVLSERVEEAGGDAKEAATSGYQVADKTHKKAEQADIAGDEVIGAAAQALHKLVSRAVAAAGQAREAAEKAMKTSKEVATEAARKAEEAAKKADLVPKLVRQVISSREFILTLIMVVLGAMFAAVALSVGIVSLGP
jgi:hypothetical protein